MFLRNKSVNDIIYEIAFIIILVGTYLDCSELSLHINFHLNLILLLSSVVLFIKILLDKHTLFEWILNTLVIIIALYITYNSKDSIILTDTLLIIGAKKENFLYLMRIFFYIGTIFSSIYIIGSTLGLVKNIARVGHSGIRYSLGFSYPVELSESILILCIVYSILHFHNIRWYRIAIFMLLSYFILKVPNTRMDFYCMIILIIVTIIKKYNTYILQRFPFNLSWMSLIVMSLLSLYSAVFYNKLLNMSSLYYKINYSLENRLFFSHYWFSSLPLTLFGRNMKVYYHHFFLPDGDQIFGYIDQAIIHLLVNYGLVICLLFIFIYSLKMFKLFKNGMNYYVLLFMIIVIRGFFDINLFQLFGDPFLVIVFADLYNVKKDLINR